MGIERSIKAAEKAQIIILITEPGIPYPDIPVREDQTIINIVNKTEQFQALHNIGLKELEDQLVAAVPHDDNDLLVTNLRHYDALTQANADIQRALKSLLINLSGDLVAEDLRQCLNHLSQILGQITTDEVLANIFKNFCVGK